VTDPSHFAEQRQKVIESCKDRSYRARFMLMSEYLDGDKPKDWPRAETFRTVETGFSLNVEAYFVEQGVFKTHFGATPEEVDQRLLPFFNTEMVEMSGIVCKKDGFPVLTVPHHLVTMFTKSFTTFVRFHLQHQQTLHGKHAYNNFMYNVKMKGSKMDCDVRPGNHVSLRPWSEFQTKVDALMLARAAMAKQDAMNATSSTGEQQAAGYMINHGTLGDDENDHDDQGGGGGLAVGTPSAGTKRRATTDNAARTSKAARGVGGSSASTALGGFGGAGSSAGSLVLRHSSGVVGSASVAADSDAGGDGTPQKSGDKRIDIAKILLGLNAGRSTRPVCTLATVGRAHSFGWCQIRHVIRRALFPNLLVAWGETAAHF
jgi:hypothetical protein